MESINALGVLIDNISLSAAQKRIRGFFDSPHFHQIVTVNPDFIMLARKSERFKSVLNSADLALADGVGISLPAFLQGTPLKERIPGCDLTEYIFSVAEKDNLAVFLLASTKGLSTVEETKAAILKKHPRLRIDGCNVDIQSPRALEAALKKVHGHVVLANFGAPLQDTFLAELRSYSPENTVRLTMGVGGTFDFLTTKQKRAPLVVRHMGMEWLWRLILQPRRRLKRTFNYVIVFSFLCLQEVLFRTWEKQKTSLRSRF